MIDGGFYRKKSSTGSPTPKATDVEQFYTTLMKKKPLSEYHLLRVYWYDGLPLEKEVNKPLDGGVKDFGKTDIAKENQKLIDGLRTTSKVAVRLGKTDFQGWKLGEQATKKLKSGDKENVEARDFVPDIEQTGVDMRIGLDIAWLSLKKIVDALILVTGDSDFVPSMKMARKEGLLVYLQALGHGVRPQLKEHADVILEN
jgi:uncharacterized LabA/DUF88 family protein